MSEFALRPAWKSRDPVIERDAELFWQRERVLGENADVSKRLDDLCAAAYLGEHLVGLTSARIRQIDFLRCKLAMFRCVVAHPLRIRQMTSGLRTSGASRSLRVARIAPRLSVFSRDLLESWSRENPNEEVLGLGAVVQSRHVVEGARRAIWPNTKLAFIGYTAEGYQMRVYWFAHAKISDYWPGRAAVVKTPAQVGEEDD